MNKKILLYLVAASFLVLIVVILYQAQTDTPNTNILVEEEARKYQELREFIIYPGEIAEFYERHENPGYFYVVNTGSGFNYFGTRGKRLGLEEIKELNERYDPPLPYNECLPGTHPVITCVVDIIIIYPPSELEWEQISLLP